MNKLRTTIRNLIRHQETLIDASHRRALFGRLSDICSYNGWDLEETRHALVSVALGRPVDTFTTLTNKEVKRTLDKLTFLC